MWADLDIEAAIYLVLCAIEAGVIVWLAAMVHADNRIHPRHGRRR